MPDMVHYIAIFELPDGEHLMHGWSESMSTARKHVDDHILGRRRAHIPDEPAKLLSINKCGPDWQSEVLAETKKIEDKYPNRTHVSEQFTVPNQVLEQRVTPDPNEV